MKKPILVAIGVYLMLFFAVKAVADEQFALIDVDSSGTISLQEARANFRLLEQFLDLDTDGDGELCHREFSHFTG